jgi:hypothetical protein
VIVQATIEPARGVLRGLRVRPTLTWKPVVRLTARQGLAGQLGTVAGLVVPSTPTSLSVAGAAAGTASATAALATRALAMRLMCGINTPAPWM